MGPQTAMLPAVWPSHRALLDRLPAQTGGGLILDLACGVGSPTFEAAKQNPEARVLGVDRAGKLIDAARALAAAHGIGNVDFQVMPLDELSLADQSVDAAVSHFAFLQEGDVAESVKELSRVLKDGASFSVAAWDVIELNTLASLAVSVLERHVPEELLPDMEYLSELAAPGLRERLLREAGFSTVHTELLSWRLPLPSATAVIASPVPFGRAVDSLSSSELDVVKTELGQGADQYRTPEGTYAFPMTCRLYWGNRWSIGFAPSADF
ncbi:class I SAM-dependent methyltransferase [Streptomyces sp. NPDC001980]|uniref:class I SAM-dependent methyltransferase n=1 Tax=Streptomyces sp. NPDC001980 TaxID=3157126 RepID=UPI00333071C8